MVAAPEPPPAPEPQPVLPPQPEAVVPLEPEPVPAQPEVLRHVACLACLYAAALGSQSSSYTTSHSLFTYGLPLTLLSVMFSCTFPIYLPVYLRAGPKDCACDGMTVVSSCMSKRRGS